MLYKIDFTSIPWESPMKGVRCRTVRQGNKQIRLVEYTQEMEPHWCDKGHCGYILEGTFEITFDDRVDIFESGDGVFIPSGTPHRHMAKVLSDKVLAVFAEDL